MWLGGFTCMLESITSVSLLTLMEILGPVVLGLALVYAIARVRRRSRAERAYTDEATRRLYREGDRQEKRS
jgi:NhaP-type Na+/H+ or K+/H+ antiporter